MALDLSLMAIPDKGSFILEKAFHNNEYAGALDKIQQPTNLKRYLEMVRNRPDDRSQTIIEQLIEDSQKILNLYPKQSAENYSFYSVNRGYDTINYLLTEVLKDEQNEIFLKYPNREKFLYSGQEIAPGQANYVRFQYFDAKQTAEIYDVLKIVDFEKMARHYITSKMTVVYKLTSYDNIDALEKEYIGLREFYRQATLIDGFIIIKID